jgi:AcrR family transcriptional regulator
MAEKRKRRRRLGEVERRAQIVQAAVTLFAAQGYARTTTADIAREAGISEGTIYRYFASKQELLFSFIESTALAPLRSALAAPADDVGDEEMLRRLLEERFTLTEQYQPLMKVAIGEALFDPELAQALRRRMAGPGVALLKSFLNERIRDGRFRDVDPEIAARAVVGMVIAFAVIWPVLLPQPRRTRTPRRLAAALASLFLDGVRRSPHEEVAS